MDLSAIPDYLAWKHMNRCPHCKEDASGAGHEVQYEDGVIEFVNVCPNGHEFPPFAWFTSEALHGVKHNKKVVSRS